MGLKVIVHNIKADGSAHQPPLLVLENADPSLELDQYLPYSLHNPILITSTNQAVSHFASAQDYKLELPNSADLQTANSLCQSIEKAFAPLLHVVTIVAKGGTGKTQLVLRFISENLSRFVHIWFFDAASDATLTADFKKLGKAVGKGESIKDVQDFLERMQEDWLLILDNADDPKVELSKYIPQCNHGNIIITSRLTEIIQMASPGAYLNFLDLEQSDAVNLLLKHAHQDPDNNNQQLASDIVDVLGCQALAVATAGAYIASTVTCTLENYLSLFKQKSRQLLKYKMKSLDGYQKTVFSAFQLSFNQLSSSTKLFMQICAFFHHTAIPVEIFYRAAAFTGNDLQPQEKEKTPAVEELKYFLSLFTYKWSWNDSINELSHFGLIIYSSGAKAISFHPIIYICIQETISDEDKDRLYQIVLLLFARAAPNDNTNINYQFRRLLIAHAECIYKNNLFTFFIYDCFANIFNEAGLWIKAESIHQKALIYYKCCFGKDHHNTLRCENKLGHIYRKLRQLKKAEILQKKTLELYKKVLGESHPDTLYSMSSLALTYSDLGRLEEAEMLQKETLELCKKEHGESHPETLYSMRNLAWMYGKLERLKEAELLQEETFELYKKVYGESHPETLKSMRNLAWMYGKLGRLKEAEMLKKKTLELCKTVLGECHPDTLYSMSSLALTYSDIGRLKEAEMLQKETLELYKKALGESHPDTLNSMSSLALIYGNIGKWEEAKCNKHATDSDGHQP
ncbi:P-loop containing nucleoside triphosphate hydrolase protein [Armillaria mellea]|nr:P-loop containing nucleoside triphosphate hydrolase protein [Armillaria mellea]